MATLESVNLRNVLEKFSEVEAIVVADREGIQLASAFAVEDSIFKKKEIFAMMIDALFMANNHIQLVSSEIVEQTSFCLAKHIVQVSRIGSLAIIVVLQDSKNQALAMMISKDLRQLYLPLSKEVSLKLGSYS